MTPNLNLVVLDSNFILLPFQFKIDYLNEIRVNIEGNIKFIVFRQILNELEAKRKREPKASKFSRLLNSGLSYLEKNEANYAIDFIDSVKKENETTDEFLLQKSIEFKADKYTVFLATNDTELRKIVEIALDETPIDKQQDLGLLTLGLTYGLVFILIASDIKIKYQGERLKIDIHKKGLSPELQAKIAGGLSKLVSKFI